MADEHRQRPVYTNIHVSQIVAYRLPPAGWVSILHRASGALMFVLLPLVMKSATFALIYADNAHAGSIDLGERELALLRTLRNQAVMAFKQAGA